MDELYSTEEKVIDIDAYRITVRELTAFDYLSARKILGEDRDDDVAIDLCLAAISMKKFEKKLEDGTYENVPLPQVVNVKDLMIRTKMPLHLWKKFTKESAEFNKLASPPTLEK